MTYFALLRGINVGGNNKVPMKQLAQIWEQAGLTQVKTYINSGNIIFQSQLKPNQLITLIEKAIEQEFGFAISVQIRDFDQISQTLKALPETWVNNDHIKCDVLFLAPKVDKPAIINDLPIKKPIDEVQYTPGAVIWKIDRANATKSKITKLVGTKLYKQMTIRNANTLRKIHALMSEVGEGTIVGANSLVKGKLKPHSVYLGQPAKFYCSVKNLQQK